MSATFLSSSSSERRLLDSSGPNLAEPFDKDHRCPPKSAWLFATLITAQNLSYLGLAPAVRETV
jgi:hypothetical protein